MFLPKNLFLSEKFFVKKVLLESKNRDLDERWEKILEKSQKIDFSLISSIDRLDNGVIFIRNRGERVMMRWVGCVFKI